MECAGGTHSLSRSKQERFTRKNTQDTLSWVNWRTLRELNTYTQVKVIAPVFKPVCEFVCVTQ